MKHAIIIAHPRAQSFTGSAAQAYAEACEALGHDTTVRDLYRIGFDPCLKVGELPFANPFRPEADVMIERNELDDCDVFAFFYPLWLNAPPAIIKGYLERAIGFGFAYGAGGHSYRLLLSGRKMISFSSSGAPLGWIKQIGALSAAKTLFDDYFANLCGMTALEHVHVGGVLPGASTFFVEARLYDVRKKVNDHFGENHGTHDDPPGTGPHP